MEKIKKLYNGVLSPIRGGADIKVNSIRIRQSGIDKLNDIVKHRVNDRNNLVYINLSDNNTDIESYNYKFVIEGLVTTNDGDFPRKITIYNCSYEEDTGKMIVNHIYNHSEDIKIELIDAD